MIYRLALVVATVIWGSSFIVVKDTTDAMTPAWLLAIRFIFAALILAAIFYKKRSLYFKKEYILVGCLFGAALFCAYFVQTVGIIYTTPGKNAFLTGVYCVLVPFFAWFATRKAPTRYNLIAAVLCLGGIGLVSLGNETGINIGDLLTLIGAVFYAIHIVLVSRFAQGRDIFVLTMWQFASAGVIAAVVVLISGQPLDVASLSAGNIAGVAFLTVMCTAVALLLQNVGQAHVPPASASLLLSLESVFGVAFSVALGAETLTLRVVCGFALIFLAIIISEVLADKLTSWSKKAAHES